MVVLHPISTPTNNSTISDQTSPSSSSPTSPLPCTDNNNSPHLMYHYPPSSSSSSFIPATFPSTMEFNPIIFPTSSLHLYHTDRYYYYHYPYLFSPNNQNPPFYYYYYYYPHTSLPCSQPINSDNTADPQLVPPLDVDLQTPPSPSPPLPSAGKYKYPNWSWKDKRKRFQIQRLNNEIHCLNNSGSHNNNDKRVSKMGKEKNKGRKSNSGNFKEKHASGSHRPLPPPSSSSHLAGCTTVMVKNIPNSLSRRALIDLLDHHCREHNHKVAAGPCPFQYDFLYIPFDFQYHQNVGYAFVNFTSVEGAATLYNSWSGRGWTNSSKIREITRARLQGLEQCKKQYHLSAFFCCSEEYLPVEFSPPRDGFNGDACKSITIGKWFYRGDGVMSSRAKGFIPPRLSPRSSLSLYA